MRAEEIREIFLEFFRQKGHKIVSSSSLIPDDPSVLFTTAGMQQFKPYFLGKADPVKDFGTRRVASVQKSFRTSDIDEVGDESHLTFFQMLGHFSFGDYFKKETIAWTYELLTKFFGVDSKRISATVFSGDETIPFDEESYQAWRQFLPETQIRRGARQDNVWGPAGPEGPCGAANEVYVDDLEVATLVFMEYYCAKDGVLTSLPQKGVDVGWGFERITKVIQGVNGVFKIDTLAAIIELVPNSVSERHKRVIVDHLRGATFLLADGVRPSNKERGYVLRRIMRRIFVYEYIYKIPSHVFEAIIHDLVHEYGEIYPELLRENKNIGEEFKNEREKFGKTLQKGIKELEQEASAIDERKAFQLYETFGLPFEIIKELGKEKTKGLRRDLFDEEFKKHQEISRAGIEKKFGGHGLLLDTGELKAADEQELKIVTRLHTATHLLQSALGKVLGSEIAQQGSDITVERTRFDFSFSRKLTSEEIKQVENLVNDVIGRDFEVEYKEMSYEDAVKSGALHFFRQKYPPRVKVYTVFDPKTGEVFSQELCGGPHVNHTGEIGKFRIIKEESSSAGVRRIRATAE